MAATDRSGSQPLSEDRPPDEHMAWARKDWDAIERLNGEGFNDSQIAARVGVHKCTARKVRIRLGLPMRAVR